MALSGGTLAFNILENFVGTIKNIAGAGKSAIKAIGDIGQQIFLAQGPIEAGVGSVERFVASLGKVAGAATAAVGGMLILAKGGEKLIYKLFPAQEINDTMNLLVSDIEQVYEDGYYVGERYSDKATENISKIIKSNQQLTSENKQQMQDYVNSWKPVIDRMSKLGVEYDKLDDYNKKIYDTYNDIIKLYPDLTDEVDSNTSSVNESTDALNAQANATIDLRNRYAELDAFLANLGKEASGADRIEATKKAYEAMLADFKAGKWGTPAVQDWINTFVPEGVKEALGYDMEKIARYAAGETVEGLHSELSSLLESEDPMAAFVKMIQDAGGELRTTSGDLAAYINADGELIIESWGTLAEVLGTTDAGIQLLKAGLQDYNANLILSTEQIKEVYANLGKNIEDATPEEIATAIKLTFDGTPEELANIATQIVADANTKITPAEVIAELNKQSLTDALDEVEEGADGTTGQATIETSADPDSLSGAKQEIAEGAAGINPTATISTTADTSGAGIDLNAFIASPKTYEIPSDFDPDNALAEIDGLINTQREILLDSNLTPTTVNAVEQRLQELTKAREVLINIKTNQDVIDSFNDSLKRVQKVPELRTGGLAKFVGIDFVSQFETQMGIVDQYVDDGIASFVDFRTGTSVYQQAIDKIKAANNDAALSGETVLTMIDSFRDSFGPWVDQINAFKEAGGDATPEMEQLLALMAQLDGLEAEAQAKIDASEAEAVKDSLEKPIESTVTPTLDKEAAESVSEQLSEDPPAVTTEVNADTTDVDQKITQIENENPEVEVTFKDSNYKTTKSHYDSIKSKGVSVGANYYSTNYDTITEQINNLANKKIEIPVTYKATNTPKYATGIKSSAEGLALVNDGAPVNGSSAELIVQNGSAFIAGNGQETLVNLEKGATVYTAQETNAILKGLDNNQRSAIMNGGISSYATGTPTNISNIISGVGTGYTPYVASGTKGSSSTSSSGDAWKDEFERWLKERKHALAMDLITEQQYYDDLEEMYKKYFSDLTKYQEEYWKYEEEVYNYRKKELEDTIELENALSELAKAKTQKVLVYKDGRFQYVQNLEAIARAQQEVNAYANGTTNAFGGLDLVGENGPELRVLNQGDGIIASDITKNLMRLGTMSVGGLGGFGNNSTDIFNIGEVVLENVNNVEDIFNGLRNLAIQKTSSRI